VRDAALKNTAG